MMRILVISSTPWSSENSFGNTFNNIFSGFGDEIEVYNIFCSNEAPDNSIVKEYFQIAPKNLLNKLFGKSTQVGVRFSNQFVEREFVKTANEKKVFNFARKHRFQVMFWARDLLWKIVRWKSESLVDFIVENKIDLIFTPIYYSSYMNDLLQFVAKIAKVPVWGYISDDCYTLKLLNFSPLFWIDRFWKRHKVRKSIDICEKLYVISEIQKQEYETIFHKECKILTKAKDFSQEAPIWTCGSGNFSFVFAGNIGDDRWKSLALIADAIAKLNKENLLCEMHIYTSTPLTRAMRHSLMLPGTTLHGAVTYQELQGIQCNADIQIHVEGLSLKARLLVHQSFSTKLVDLFALGKCIFVVGPRDVASVSHLLNNDAAVVATTANEVYQKLKWLLGHPNQIVEYGRKAYECGKKYHNFASMHAMLKTDFERFMDRAKQRANCNP
ncbi:MAG: hypothetical protein II943_03900 [Victivallales bacterium]|nr:hypothetical protein [Victivallales bacterium]